MTDMTTIPAMATITEVHPLSGDTSFFRLGLKEGEAQGFTFTPGQFVQLSVPAAGEFPISLAGSPGHGRELELCVRKAGHVTAVLHNLRPGDPVAVRGPFGTGFPVERMRGNDVILLAGGLGIAPLRSLFHYFLEHREEYGAITLMYGAREPSAILFRDELAELACRRDIRLMLTVDFLTEEPAGGPVCRVGLLPGLLMGIKLRLDQTYAAVCGPPALYRCLITELLGLDFPENRIFLSLERRMKCGIGLCCHCAVGDFFCCTDGPVFSYDRIKEIPGVI
ncbi:MAG: oxidoreductase FAD-binding [Geobacteraceae bacterium]|nr:MAG: oxidoreductase FAD-binding [Geobacteraceae bacterium]